MVDEELTIGELARRTGTATSALRYYEVLGLLRPTARISGQRRYGEAAVALVGVILFLRDAGFTLDEVKQLIASRARSPRAWRTLAGQKVDELSQQIDDAQVARTAIEHALHCPKDDILECPNFWATVGGRLEGRSMRDGHALIHG